MVFKSLFLPHPFKKFQKIKCERPKNVLKLDVDLFIICFIFFNGTVFFYLLHVSFCVIQLEAASLGPESYTFNEPPPPIEWHLTKDPAEFSILTV